MKQFQQMSDVEWGRLARQQDQLAKNEDHRLRERQNHHKLLYKQQLQKMIADKEQASKTYQLLERQQIQQQLKMTNSIDHTNNTSQIFQSRLKQQASYNYSVGRDRKQRLKSELAEEKNVLKEKFKKIDTEITEEREKAWKDRQSTKKRLAQFYEEQMQGCSSRKEMEKLENRKFEQLAQQLEERKELERSKHINKIKHGYMQNPESYDLIKQIYDIKQSQKAAFFNKITAPTPESCPANLKQLQTIQTSNYNHNVYLQKLNRKKTIHQKQLAEEQFKILTLQQELTQEQQKQRRKKNEQRKILQTELEHQISETEDNRMRWKRMSEDQTRINKDAENQVVLPGLRKDYKDYKQELIIDSFLKYGRPYPIHSLETQH